MRPMPYAGGIFRHYKGGLYTVLMLVEHHETRATVVIYVSHTTGKVLARLLEGTEHDPDGWMDEVDGKDRFVELSSEETEALGGRS